MGATSKEEPVLKSKNDFRRFCAELRARSLRLDEIVEGLRELAQADLRPTERGRFAHFIAKHLGVSFDVSDVRSVALLEWPPEIAMALRSQVPTPSDSPVTISDRQPALLPEHPKDRDLHELSRERSSPLTVIFMGDEDEHRASIERLSAIGVHCPRENSLQGLRDAFAREAVVGIVVGASWWTASEHQLWPPRRRLRSILELSNLCWIKLVRCAAWAPLEVDLTELCVNLHFAEPRRTRLTVEEQAAITNAEQCCLADAARDLFFGERTFSYEFQPIPTQDRILRAASSRYIRWKYPMVHGEESRFRVRALANRGEHGLASLVSVVGTDVAFVIKVSPFLDAQEEARRFRSCAHGTSLEMEFFCHGMLGALVFAPVNARMGEAISLEGKLTSRAFVDRSSAPQGGIGAIDSTIAVLQQFSEHVRPSSIGSFCSVESEAIETEIARCGSIVVAGETIDLKELYAHGRQAIIRCSSRWAVQHGDAHPGNVLFSVANTAILIDYECVGLAPACYDLSMLWVHVLASRFIAVMDELSTVSLFRDLLAGVPFAVIEDGESRALRLAVNYEAVYLVHKALGASFAVMAERGCTRKDVHGIVAIVLCRELLNPELQQFAIRCALAAISSLLHQDRA